MWLCCCLREGRRFAKLFYSSGYTSLCRSLCLSCLPFISFVLCWKLRDRDVSTVQAAVSREETAQPCCKTKTRQTNGSTLHATERWLYECVCTSLNVSTLFSSPGLMAYAGSGNVDTTLGLITANKQTNRRWAMIIRGPHVDTDTAPYRVAFVSFRYNVASFCHVASTVGTVLTVVCNTRVCSVFGLCPLSGILKNTK
jgi:hypothetical protein